MSIKIIAACCATIFGLATTLAFGNDGGQGQVSYKNIAATGHCQPSQTHITGVRYRPFGIYNSMEQSIYVNCSFPTDRDGDPGSDELYVWAYNNNFEPVQVTCSAHGGNRALGISNYTGGANLAGKSSAAIHFPSIDRRSGPDGLLGLSCLLPPGVELSNIAYSQFSRQSDL
jgi:hypothetical protein